MDPLTVSNALLWACVIALSLVVLALARQVGLLHERIAPAGALLPAGGPAVGDRSPQLELRDLDGAVVAVGAEQARGLMTLLFFVSPTCPVCKTLIPTVLRVGQERSDSLRIVLASDGEEVEHRRFAGELDAPGVPYLLSTELGLAFAVAKLPYAVLIDGSGVVRAKGIVNTREHVESLFEAHHRGVASIQEYLAGDGREAEGGREGEAA